MRLFYLVAAHNEELQITNVVQRLTAYGQKLGELHVFLLDNGSSDQTWTESQKMAARYRGQVHALHSDEAGLGIAFRMGLNAVSRHSPSRSDWVVLAAADLPFGFTDLEGVLQRQSGSTPDDVVVYVGSKTHPESRVARNWKRSLGSRFFYVLRRLIIGLKIQDTQGSILIRGDAVERLKDFQSDNYFFSVELLDQAIRIGQVREIPVTLEPDLRPSRVHLLRDGWRMLIQLIRHRSSKTR